MVYIGVMITILVVISVILVILCNNARNRWIWFAACCVFVSSFLMTFRLSSIPASFMDEANGFYDAYCLAHWGVTSNLISHPIYLKSAWDQGQSVLYVTIAKNFVKLFGYHLWAFRLPLVLISIGSLLLMLYTCVHIKVSPMKTAMLSMVVSLSPWIIMTSRFAMDCNISVFMTFIGILLLINTLTCTNQGLKCIGLTAAFWFIGLTVYGYNVAWIFIPLFMVLVLITLLRWKKVRLRELIVPLTVMFFEVLPMIIFAVRSNIPKLNVTKKILFWTYPSVNIASRGQASFITLGNHPLTAILSNVWHAISNLFIMNNDTLPWNDIPGIGLYYWFALPFFVIGIIYLVRNRKYINDLILSGIVAMIPILMLVTPSFNHYIFLHVMVLITAGLGVVECIGSGNKSVLQGVLFTYAFALLVFCGSYFSVGASAKLGYPANTANKLAKLRLNEYKNVYITPESNVPMIMIRDFYPTSPYEYQATKQMPYQATGVGNRYRNIHLITNNKGNFTKNALLITANGQSPSSIKGLKGRQCQRMKDITLNGIKVNLYKIE